MGQPPDTQLAAKELILIKPGSKLSAALLSALAIAFAFALPGVAAAQDPSVDQYTPTAPDGGGSVPTSPVPNTDGGNGPGPSADAGSNGGSSGDETDTGSTAPAAPAATAPVDPATTASGDGSGGKDKHQSKDQRTLDRIAAAASDQREDAGASHSAGPATELLRSDNGGGLGMGILLWAVLGVTALWAVATLVRRRQDGDGHPA